MRWKDGVDQDMRILEVKNWKKVALDRDEWAKLLKKSRRPPRAVRKVMSFSYSLFKTPRVSSLLRL